MVFFKPTSNYTQNERESKGEQRILLSPVFANVSAFAKGEWVRSSIAEKVKSTDRDVIRTC